MNHNLFASDLDHILGRRHTTVDQVHALMLAAIVSGELGPGEELRDQAWATKLKVSRTPIREAIKRLEARGIVDIAAARYTRLASFTLDEARREVHDWAAIHLAMASALCELGDRSLLSVLERTHRRHAATRGRAAIAESFAFFERVRVASESFSLQLGAVAVSYRVVLALPNLPDLREANHALHEDVLHALRNRTAHGLAGTFADWARMATAEQPGL